MAGPPRGTAELLFGAASVAQAAPSDTRADDKVQAADLLRRARQLMAQNELEAAEVLISQAESLNVDYGVLPLGDTPKKARRDLQRKRNAANQAPIYPSQLFSPLGAKKKAPPTDPFAGWSGDSPAAGYTDKKGLAQSYVLNGRNELSQGNLAGAAHWYRMASQQQAVFGLEEDSPAKLAADIRKKGGQVDQAAARAGGPSGAAAGISLATDAENEDLLLQARRALAFGDLRRASSLVEQAKLRRTPYGPLDDTPEKVEAAIAEYQDLMARPKDTEAYRRAHARMLMNQSEALFRGGDYDRAEELANWASRQHLTYGPFEASPQGLLQRIAAARSQANPSTSPPSPIILSAKPPSTATPSLAARRQAVELTRQARASLEAGQWDWAEELAERAEQLGVSDSAYAPNEDRPGLVLYDIRKARQRNPSGVIPAGGQAVAPATGTLPVGHTASPAWYDPSNDPTRNVSAAHQKSGSAAAPRQLDFAQAAPTPDLVQGPVPPPPVAIDPNASAQSLFQQGEAALKAHDAERAYQYFRQADARGNELDPVTAQHLQSYLQLLSVPNRSRQPGGPAGSVVDEAAARQHALTLQVSAEVAHQQSKARAMCQNDPKGALALLAETRKQVESAGLEPAARQRVLARVDRHLAEIQRLIEQNRPRIELEENNQLSRDAIEREKHLKLQTQEKLALMVDDFNRKMDEQRFAEAEVVAKQAAELDPDNPIVQQLLWLSKFVWRFHRNEALRAQKEDGFWVALDRVEESAVPFDDVNPYQFGDPRTWEDLTGRRAKLLERGGRRTEKEIEIEQRLKTPVSLEFKDEPLSNILDRLAELGGVNLYLDPQGLAEEGVTSDTPVTIQVRQEIMLKSALNLILEPLRLSYVIKDEVLKITSEQLREGEVYTASYNVADLVVPIPNFVPGDMGLASAYHKAMGNVGFGGFGPFGAASTPLAVVASKEGNQNSAAINPALLAQVMSPPGQASGMRNMPLGFGPGGLGGAANADFDSLIELITSTVQPTTWDEVGGPGSVAPFPTNLSIVVSQTQDVHEEIVDLLEQLRRLQDLQVTIEVRFITLNDNFFERIGVDFDFDIDDDIDRPFQVFGARVPGQDGDPLTGTEPSRNTLDVDFDRSVTVGMQSPGVFSADLDIPFTQNSFALAVPQFGGFDAAAGAQLGFAILSDIEAFFFINAAQGDRRSNVLQAPKVTLFNGQQAFVSDTSQSPFVISVIPVVGDFAAAQQPVIVVLSEGTFMTVQAVVSPDRRFVRLTVVPFFSQIGDVRTFQFTGSQTTTTDTTADNVGWTNLGDAANPDWRRTDESSSDDSTTTRTGTTVQLPTFSFVTVTTTVSVPDGGTVLLGGIKRLSEGRNEFGVPILNKVPYVNRLFKNVGIGRETQSLMMMVTPRIIIQEEEEEKLGILPP